MEYLSATGTALKTFLFDWGVLLEIIGIVIIAPLTAALVDRDRRRRLRDGRRSAVLQLYFECFDICRSFKLAFLALKSAVDSEYIDALPEAAHRVLTDPKNVAVEEQSALRTHLEAIRYSRTLYAEKLESAERALINTQRRCERVRQDMSLFYELMEPEEAAKVAGAREGITAIDDCCHDFITNIQAEFHRKAPTDKITTVDLPKVIARVRAFVEGYGPVPPTERWYVRAYDWFQGAGPGPEAPLLEKEAEHLREQLSSLEAKGLLVSQSEQSQVAEAFQKTRRIQRYDSWIEETLRGLAPTNRPYDGA